MGIFQRNVRKIGVSAKDRDLFIERLLFFFEEQKINPKVLEPYLRHLLLISSGTGFHKIEVVIRNHKIVAVIGADTQSLDIPIKLM